MVHQASPKLACLALLVPLFGCPVEPDPEPPTPRPNPFAAVEQTGTLSLPCLTGDVHVVRTEHDVPHIYGADQVDVACAQGFVIARDRFFQMDLISRNGLGRLGELLGDEGLSADVEIRTRNGLRIAEQILAGTTGVERDMLNAFAAGVNAYIAEVKAGRLDAPSELETVYQLVGADDPTDLMADWTALNIAGVASTVNFVSGYEVTDLRNQRTVDDLVEWGLDKPDGALRNAGASADLWNNIVPAHLVESSAGFLAGRDSVPPRPMQSGKTVERGVLDRAIERSENARLRMGRSEPGFGSNSWAVHGSLTADGHPLLASDGHLSLTVPSFLFRIHLDTSVLGGGDYTASGLTIPGVPAVGLGHNGSVAWGHTSQIGDINDYYREEVVLAGDGRPAATVFQGDEVPVTSISETYTVSAALGSTAGDRTIARWITGQGRPIISLEGNSASSGDPGAVNINGDWLIAADVDGDGVITAVSSAATHFFEEHMIEHVIGWSKADNVDEWGSHLNGMTSYSQHFLAADTSGDILYSGFQSMPCRKYLPREADGTPVAGAHPQLLIDGTLYPSFTIRYREDHRIDPASDDELACTLSWDEYPHSKSPEQGYLVNSNNAPWSADWDNNLWNEDHYVGGPYAGTFRASRISELIEAGAGSHDVASMSAIQGDHVSRLATEYLLPVLAEAVDQAEVWHSSGEVDGTEGRAAALYGANQTRIDEAMNRLGAWDARGRTAASGVETLWDSPTQDDRDDAVATMIWNAFFGRYLNAIWNDEGLPSVFRPYGLYGRLRALQNLLSGVGPAGADLASMHPDRGESVFFDDLGTADQVEGRHELAVRELIAALDYLETPFGADRSGGFDTDDMDAWIWGLKHFVKFDSFVASEIGNDPVIAGVFADISITPERIPLADPQPPFGDPRRGLPGFPRPGDSSGIDAAGGSSTTNFGYASGPVMRMAYSLNPDGITGVDILPGGQSAQVESPFFHDQAELWIRNEASIARFSVAEVLEGAVGREVYTP